MDVFKTRVNEQKETGSIKVENNEITLTTENYTYGNSFGIVYDHVKTMGVSGEINVDVNRNFKLGLKAESFSYTSDDEAEAWYHHESLPLGADGGF